MLTSKERFEGRWLLILLLAIGLFTLAACSPAASAGSAEDNMDGMVGDEMEEMDHEHTSDGEHDQGATIRLISPEDGATYFVDEEIPVEVEVEGFALGEEGEHWHVFVDGTVWGMTTGSDTQQVLQGLEPGTREIAVSLAGGDHVDLDSLDSVTIIIERREQ
jgi:hypothetical protein